MRRIIQWSEAIPPAWLGDDAKAWHDRGVRFFETLWTDPDRRVRYCSAQAQIERFTLRHEFTTIAGVELSDADLETVDSICTEMQYGCEAYGLGTAKAPRGVVVEFDDDATDDDVNEELNANWRDSLPEVQS